MFSGFDLVLKLLLRKEHALVLWNNSGRAAGDHIGGDKFFQDTPWDPTCLILSPATGFLSTKGKMKQCSPSLSICYALALISHFHVSVIFISSV